MSMKYFRSENCLFCLFFLSYFWFNDNLSAFLFFRYTFIELCLVEGFQKEMERLYRMKAIFEKIKNKNQKEKLINIEMGYLWSQFRWMFSFNWRGHLITNDISDLLPFSFFGFFCFPKIVGTLVENFSSYFFFL